MNASQMSPSQHPNATTPRDISGTSEAAAGGLPIPPGLQSERVPLLRKVAYGAGGLADFFFLNMLLSLATQIYVTGMGMNMALLGIALTIPKVVGAIADPVIGTLSDNTRSRWGRRKPFILVGGIAGAVLLPLMWCVPPGSEFARFAYVALLISFFSIFYSVFSIPFGALGYELTTDYDERTRVFGWKGYLTACGAFCAAWFYKFCTLPVFENEIVGVRWLSVLVGAIMIAGTIATVWACQEKVQQQKQPSIPVGKAIRLTFGNKPFLLLQATAQLLALAMAITAPMGWLVFLNYVCRSDKSLAADITAYGGSIAFVTQLGANALGLWISTRLGKREGGIVGLFAVLLSIAILPWALTPHHPWWNVGAWIVSGLGMPLIGLMVGSMTADVCDEDELATGMRREGAYSAVNGFVGKLMQIVYTLTGNILPWIAGYTSTQMELTETLLLKMKWLMIGIQFTGVAVALIAFWFYPISRARSEETRRILNARKQTF